MNKILKAGILLIVLAIPAFVFIFLHGFGENRFEIPVYYEDGVDTTFASCEWETPHIINDFDSLKFGGHCTVVGFNSNSLSHEVYKSWRVLFDYEIYDRIQSVVLFQSDSLNDALFYSRTSWHHKTNKEVKFLRLDDFDDEIKCQFIIDTENTTEFPMVLVGPEGRIRGYYYTSDNEEFERLIHELNIMFENLK